MTSNRQTIKQILEIRSRRSSELPILELFRRLGPLQNAYEKRAEYDNELLKYFPIALVACMESYFRQAIKNIIDSSELFFNKAEKLSSRLKYNFEIIRALYGKEITIGELIDHILPLNSLTDISSQMSELLGLDYLKEVSVIYDRLAVEIHGAPKTPIINDPNAVYKYVARTFELRHIFVHESATINELKLSDVENCFDSVVIFLKASDEFLSETLFPNAPLTQAEMNEESWKELQTERNRLEKLTHDLLAQLGPDRKEKYLAIHDAWEKYIRLSIDFEGMQFDNGSSRIIMENTIAVEMIRKRVKEIAEIIEHLKE